MQTLEQIYNDFLALPEEKRTQVAQNSAIAVIDFLIEAGFKPEERQTFLCSVLGMFIAADLRVTVAEAKMFNFLLGTELTPDDLAKGFSNCVGAEYVKAMDEIIDSMPEDDKYNLCILGLAFLTADRELTQKEVDVFEKILG